MHTGYCRPTASPPPPSAQELRATIRVLPPQEGMPENYRVFKVTVFKQAPLVHSQHITPCL